MHLINLLKHKVNEASKYSKDKSNDHGEVFTPEHLIKEMLYSLPKETWSNPNLTFLDPCAGKGNFTVIIIQGLMNGLKDIFPNKLERYRHIIENQIFICEYQRESAETINKIFNIGDRFELNLYIGDTLKMPNDFFDLKFDERKLKYPENCL
jgi:type I restriction-modification system DNA methylase subunit